MSEKQYNVVLVGCGAMGHGWIDNALKIPSVKVAGLVDVRCEAAEAMADKYKLPRSVVYKTLSEAIEKTGAEIVFDVTVPGAPP